MARLIIQTPPDFRFRSTLLSHGWIELEPFGHDEEFTTLYRVHQLASGRVVRLSVTARDDEALEVEGDPSGLGPEERSDIREIVARMFRLDADLSSFYERIAGLARYEWVEAYGAGRLLRSPTVWEDLSKTLLTTNTTWSMTRAMVSRLVSLGPQMSGGMHAFPTPEQIAAIPFDSFDEHVRAGYRGTYLYELAASVAAGRLDVESWSDPSLSSAELYERLRSIKGVGPYAAGSMLKLLGHYDELAIDSAARAMFRSEVTDGSDPDDSAIRDHYEPYGEWKGLVIWMDLMRTWSLEHIRKSP